jgi:hypothetical protein
MKLCMLLYKFLHSSGVIEVQQSSISSYNSSTPLGCVSFWFNWCFKVAHKCSIGFKFGDCAGHFKRVNSYKLSQRCTLLDVCLGLLSCWKIKLVGFKLYACIVWINSLSKNYDLTKSGQKLDFWTICDYNKDIGWSWWAIEILKIEKLKKI